MVFFQDTKPNDLFQAQKTCMMTFSHGNKFFFSYRPIEILYYSRAKKLFFLDFWHSFSLIAGSFRIMHLKTLHTDLFSEGFCCPSSIKSTDNQKCSFRNVGSDETRWIYSKKSPLKYPSKGNVRKKYLRYQLESFHWNDKIKKNADLLATWILVYDFSLLQEAKTLTVNNSQQSQYHRATEVGRNLWRSSGPVHCWVLLSPKMEFWVNSSAKHPTAFHPLPHSPQMG